MASSRGVGAGAVVDQPDFTVLGPFWAPSGPLRVRGLDEVLRIADGKPWLLLDAQEAGANVLAARLDVHEAGANALGSTRMRRPR